MGRALSIVTAAIVGLVGCSGSDNAVGPSAIPDQRPRFTNRLEFQPETEESCIAFHRGAQRACRDAEKSSCKRPEGASSCTLF